MFTVVHIVEGLSLLTSNEQMFACDPKALACILKAEYDLSNFNVLYAKILIRWPILDFLTTILLYDENLKVHKREKFFGSDFELFTIL